MQESAKTAFSYARSRYKELNLPPDIQEKYDVHIHAADGATPKDGPSAGTALAISLISVLTKRPVRADTAMTGEITLRGRVLPIGGLKEKSIAALRNGIKIIIIPKGNEKDIQEFPDYIKNKIDYKPIKNLDEIIDFMLSEKISEPKALHNGKKKNGVVLPKYVK
jgi:ATP-dependent Lon protease